MMKVERQARTTDDSDKKLKLDCPAMLLQIPMLCGVESLGFINCQ